MKSGNESRSPSVTVSDASRPRSKRHGDSRSPETSPGEPSLPVAGNHDVDEVTRGTGVATSSSDPTGLRVRTEWVKPPSSPAGRKPETAQTTRPEVRPCLPVGRRPKEEQGKPAETERTAAPVGAEAIRPAVHPASISRVTQGRAFSMWHSGTGHLD